MVPPVEGTTVGVVLAGIVSLVTALSTIQTRRDGRLRDTIAAQEQAIAELRGSLDEQEQETARQRRISVAAVRSIHQHRLVAAAYGIPEDQLPPDPELEGIFRHESDPAERQDRPNPRRSRRAAPDPP